MLGSHLLVITPFHRVDRGLAAAACRAGACAAIDLGRGSTESLVDLDRLARAARGGLGLRLHETTTIDPGEIPDGVEFVVLPATMDPEPWRPRSVIVRVTDVEEALRASELGADAVIAAGSESPGRVGEETAFVLSQRVVEAVDLPVWVQGGIGPRTAAACIAGGAEGIVLEDQLALAEEASTPGEIRALLLSADGSETVVIDGHRVFTRPDLDIVSQARDARPEEVAELVGGGGLESRLLPLGQAAAFAGRLSEEHRTVSGILGAFRRGVVDGLRMAREHEPLAPGAPLARAHGTRFPILQGPMTRVSDRPEFVEAVADAGGLPFIALSLLGGPPLRELLEETAKRLRDHPWGVGILGFVPPEKRAEQLEAIEAVRPRFALIAGGRPSQARNLEERGIATYLHVPSRGLLEIFLKEGARRYVFEGRECGGHVGPLSSFTLWQNQIDRLLAFDRPEELHVVFAGGIHDARSAAMVAAMAAPLAARGARIGILMGTAYLFTAEAVSTGAIVPGYQRRAIDCEGTVLLETSPGHATRCVESEYVRAFRAEKARLERSGVSPREAWTELERLNLGRLRIASKGLVRQGEELRTVDEDLQEREGMYMIGQVAALRRDVKTMEELHLEVSEEATARLASLEPPFHRTRPVEVEGRARDGGEIAIVGMACAFPGAPDLDSYWANVVHGVDAITEVPPERWRSEEFYDPDGPPGYASPSKWGGFLDPLLFDPARYGIPPNSIPSIDPIQLMSLEIARRALEDAGYGERPFARDRTGVVFGADGGSDMAGACGFRALYRQYVGEIPDELERRLPAPTEDTFPGLLVNVIAGRVANRLDLGGENCTVSAACASSLAAASMACRWLAAGQCDMVLAGGADLHNAAGDYLMFSSVQALSPRGRCSPFDHRADGIVLGEGVGVLVLKRLEDAERDGDRIYALIRGLGSSSDGRSMGLTAPRTEGQVRALTRGHRQAGISPDRIELMEAHGTGTVVGDRTELESMNEVFRSAGARAGGCTLGSVKSQIGHTKNAAGVASMIKVAMSLHARTLPPTLHIEQPGDGWDEEESPFVFRDRPRPWNSARRLAGVSSFGFGGTNYHAVMEGHGGTPPESGLRRWPAELFLLRGSDLDACRGAAEVLLRALDHGSHRLRDLARSSPRSGSGEVRMALVAADSAELREKLEAIRRGEEPRGTFFRRGSDHPERPPVAFVFPGQGSQYTGMLGELFVAFPRLQEVLSLADESVVDRMFPPQAFDPDERSEQEQRLTETRTAQVALGVANLAMARMLRDLGLEPDAVAGHSYGEIVALSVAGAWDESTTIDLSEIRAGAILDSIDGDPGSMVAVAASSEQIESAISGVDGVAVANFNAPRQTILSGPTVAIEEAVGKLREHRLATTSIRTSCAFHSPVVSGGAERFREALDGIDVGVPRIPVWANTTAAPYPDDPEEIRAILADQIASSVRFTEQIERMYEQGIRIFLEVGPGRTLTGLIGRILGEEKPHVAMPTDVRGESPLTRTLLALGRLAVEGVPFDPDRLYAGRGARLLDLDRTGVAEAPVTGWRTDGSGSWPANEPRPSPAERIGRTSDSPSEARSTRSENPEAVVLEYLRNVRELVEGQRRVMLEYLGARRPEAEDGGRRIEAVPAEPPSGEVAAPRAESRSEPAGTRPETGGEGESLTEILVGIVSERTGYPPEMIEPDLDLEADLSIDSIKRIEIIGTLGERIGLEGILGVDRDEALEELARIRTLGGVVEWLEDRGMNGAGRGPAGSAREAPASPAEEPVSRFRLELRTALPPSENGGIEERSFALTDDGRGVAEALADMLRERGAKARILREGERIGSADGLVHLAPIARQAGPKTILRLYEIAREAVEKPGGCILGVTGFGGRFGLDRIDRDHAGDGEGVAAFLKSIAQEWPQGRVRTVDVDPGEAPERISRYLMEELLAEDDLLEVGRVADGRHTWELVPYGPSRSPEREVLDRDGVVLVTGGARGIAARVSVELARRYGCSLELVGRTPAPNETLPPEFADVDDPATIKRRLLEESNGGAAEIERRYREIVAAREVARTLASIDRAGGGATYHSVDVRDAERFAALIEDVYDRHGRIDGAIHAAGMIDDKPLVRKSWDSFARVFETKVLGARQLLEGLREGVRFVVFFSSLSSLFGNRGQTDYASANEVLDKLALRWNGELADRVLSVNWGPWDEAGMVDGTLRRSFLRRGIGMIPPEEGVRILLEELASGDPDTAQLVIAAGSLP
ncbi:MAG: SDR family NAD(P)-dependent oxidoreductase, partial [Gemmatimonadota bacterium]|nr:SDR family NAD(P)-dependent oxidoreductase [Gemmatimonadota bacterium]